MAVLRTGFKVTRRPWGTGNNDFRTGQAVGDGVAFVQGGVQIITGSACDVGGTLLDPTGVGAVVGVPAQAVSTAVGLDSVGVAETAAGNLITQASAIGPKQRASRGPGKTLAAPRRRMPYRRIKLQMTGKLNVSTVVSLSARAPAIKLISITPKPRRTVEVMD
jgi:hypothetical protein